MLSIVWFFCICDELADFKLSDLKKIAAAVEKRKIENTGIAHLQYSELIEMW